MTTFGKQYLVLCGKNIFLDAYKVGGISKKHCIENKFRRNILHIIHKNGLVTTSSSRAFLKSESNIIPSYCKDIVIPKNVPFHDFIWQNNDNKTALVDGITGTVYTYNQARSLSIRFGNGLRKWGFKKNDVLAVFLPKPHT